MEQYQYEPLPSLTSIRLIKLRPDEKLGDFSCSFVIADILSLPEYIALSYVWGDTSNTVPIICNGKTVRITPNLRDALRTFCNVTAYLWVDALCINQKNVTERNQQVNMMATIYSKAANVTVWLGCDECDDAPAIFEDIKALVEGLGTIHAAGGQFKYFDTETGDLHWALENGQACVSAIPRAIADPNEEERARLERFFRLPWFSRTWVMQEVGLAANAVVLWGGLAMEWNPIGLAAMFLLRHCRVLLDKLGLATDMENVYHLYTAFSPFTPLATFLHVIHNARRYKATDPRDKVFALLSHPTAHTVGLPSISLNCSGFEPYMELAIHFLPSLQDQYVVRSSAEMRGKSYSKLSDLPPPLLQIDYSKTVDEVYHSLTSDHIKRTKSLEILTTVQHDPENTSTPPIPSWVPRWDSSNNTPVLGFYSSTHFASANRDAIVTPPPPEAPDTLTIRGTLVTRIVHHTDLLSSSSFDLPLPTIPAIGPSSPLVQNLWVTNPIAQTWLSSLADVDPESYPQLPLYLTGNGYAIVDRTGSNVYDAFIHTWVAGKAMGEVDSFDLNADSSAYWSTLFFGTLGDPSNQVSKMLSYSLEERIAMVADDTVPWKRYRDSAARVCDKRKFFFTKKGFFGLGPGALRAGDFVAALLGSDVPFVVREIQNGYYGESEEARRLANRPVPMDARFQLVGECYVHGLMQGQAVRGREIERNIVLV